MRTSKGCEKLFSFLQLGKFRFYWILIIRWQSHETSHFLATIKIFEVFTLFCKTINVVPTVVWPVHFSSSWFVFLFPSTWYTLEWDRWLLIDQIRRQSRNWYIAYLSFSLPFWFFPRKYHMLMLLIWHIPAESHLD